MLKIFAILSLVCLFSCKNNSSSEANSDSSKASPSTSNVANNWSKEDEQEFINSCMENAKATLGDTAAYARCKCMLGKVQEKFPTLDSSITVLKDTAVAAKITAGCK